MIIHRRGGSSQLKSIKHMSHLNIRQRIVLTLTGIALAIIIIFSMWIMRRGKPKPVGTTLPIVERGTIYDRRGHILATQVEEYTISLWLPSIRTSLSDENELIQNQQIEEFSALLAPVILWPQQDLYTRILNHPSNTLVLLRRADVQMKERLERVVQEHNLIGLRIEPEFSRSYPQGDLAAPLLGYLNLDGQGGGGLEYAFDRFLSPNTIINDQDIIHGYSLELTLDINLQASVEALMKQGLQDEEAKAAVALVMDAHSGEILSYVSLPSFNPTFYNRYTENERTNRPVVEAYEPGSVFKVFTMAALIDAGVVDLNETYECKGYYEETINGETYRIKCTAAHGVQTAADILANSCNAGMAHFSERMNQSDFRQAIEDFGFGKRTNIPLSGENTGLLAETSRWSARTKPTIAMGQEIGVSSLQILQASTAFANNGIMVKPRIVKHLLDGDGNIYQSYDREEVGRAISSHTVRILLAQLQHSVEAGIARRLQMRDLSIGGKTGTSQTIDPLTNSYSEKKYIASTLAFVPAYEPQYVVYVLMHHPGKSIWGSNVAAPLARGIIELLISHVGLPTASTQFIALNSLPNISSPLYPEPQEILPQLEGMSLRQALHFFQHDDLFFRIDGLQFWVAEQFPPANTLIRPSLTVRLTSGSNEA